MNATQSLQFIPQGAISTRRSPSEGLSLRGIIAVLTGRRGRHSNITVQLGDCKDPGVREKPGGKCLRLAGIPAYGVSGMFIDIDGIFPLAFSLEYADIQTIV